MYLFFDTETTGLPKNYKAAASDSKNWPRMVQLAWITADVGGNVIDTQNFIIKPDGYTIPAEVSKIHGITTEIAINQGHDLSLVLKQFSESVTKAQCIVAHNISFDEKIVGAEFFRMKMLDVLVGKPQICTMKSSTDYCKIPGPYGNKWPNLAELHKKLFKTSFSDAHNALADVSATVKCFFELKKLGVIR